MRWDQVSSHTPRAIGSTGRDDYLSNGFLVFPGLILNDELDDLRVELAKLIDHSRSLERSTHLFDFETDHSATDPRLRRAACIDDAAPAFWNFCRESVLVDIAADILGPNVRFRDAFANFKWSKGGAAVGWHQDIAFYPHTNTGTCQFIVAVEDVTAENGPLQVVPGSHRGEAFSHYAPDGTWTGAIDDSRLHSANIEAALAITGPAGTVSVHHGMTLHASAPNHSEMGRPVLVITYAAADAIPYTAPPYQSSHYGALVRGVEPGIAHHEEMLLTLPPDWTHGYTSIFTHQDVLDHKTETS